MLSIESMGSLSISSPGHFPFAHPKYRLITRPSFRFLMRSPTLSLGKLTSNTTPSARAARVPSSSTGLPETDSDKSYIRKGLCHRILRLEPDQAHRSEPAAS